MRPSCYVGVYGCQMNVRDSETIRGLMESAGYRLVEEPAGAEVVILVSCAVREHAETRVLGRLSQLAGGRGGGGPLTVLCGCVAEEHGEELLERYPALDLVVGPDRYLDLPALLAAGERGASVGFLPGADHYDRVSPGRTCFPRSFVTVMRGCDNYCTYCIVPYVRGGERSRAPREVLGEVDRLVAGGYTEVTLLGQNVTSYSGGGRDFAWLLSEVARRARQAWVRFVTGHPRDLTRDVLSVMASEPNVCPQLHLPLQAGSARVLALMNRGYTPDVYIDKVALARELVPGVVLSTDVIAGFPGETREDFEETMALMREVRFDHAFMFRYSEREGTAACGLPGSVPVPERLGRLRELQELQRSVTVERSRALIGEVREVMVTGPAAREGQQAGRTPGGRLVVMEGTGFQPGEVVDVRIERADGWTHHGIPLRRGDGRGEGV